MRETYPGSRLPAQGAHEALGQPLLSVAEVARLLGLSTKSVQRLVARGACLATASGAS